MWRIERVSRFKIIAVLAIAILIGVVIFAGNVQKAIGAVKPPLKIGTVYWQSGGALMFGRGDFTAVKLAAKEINERGGILGGRMIEILTYDEGYSAEEGVAAVKKALADGCEAIVGFQDSTGALPAQAYCKQRGIILTTTGAGTPLLTKGSYPGYFRSGFMCQASDRARARWVEDMGFKRVVYLAVDSKYSIDALKDYRYVWDRPGSKVKLLNTIWIPYDAADAKLETTKAASLKPDFIFGNTWGDQIVVSQAQTLKEVGFQGTWTICYNVMLDYMVEELGPLGNGSWHCFNFLHNPDVPENDRFYRAFKQMSPDAAMSGFAEAAYEGMWVTALAIDKAGGTEDLKKYDEALMTIDWMTPRGAKIEILRNRESFHPTWSNAELQDGKWTNFKPMPILKSEYFVD
jgi:branched-chain amino acid transport system substrate-binding protein